MTFEPGKTYRTAEAHEAGVDRDDGREPAPLIGWIDDGGGKFPSCWNRKGHWQGNSRAAPGRNLLPPAPVDEASWRAGAEAMREAVLKRLSRPDAPFYSPDHLIRNTEMPPLPTPPAAPAPEPERLSGWVNIHPGAPIHPTKASADRAACSARIACIDLSQHRKGEGL